MSLPEDYLAVLKHLGRAFTAYKAATSVDPILVGGAATALGTTGAFMSADFDVVAADDAAFAHAMASAGFLAEQGTGHLAGGSIIPTMDNMPLNRSAARCSTVWPIASV